MSHFVRKLQLTLFGILFVFMMLLSLGVFAMDNLTERDNFIEVVDNSTFAHYDTDYQCTFLQCMFSAESRYMVISAEGNGFYDRIKFFLILGVIISAALFMLYSHAVHTSLRNIGIPLIATGLLVFVPTLIPRISNQYIDVNEVINLLFTPIMYPLVGILAAGIGLIVASFVLSKDVEPIRKK